MSKSKKYDYKITEQSSSGWKAEIIRQVSSTRNSVSKSQGDFETEAKAKQWAESELEKFVLAQAQRNDRKSEKRKTNQVQREDRSTRKAAKTAAAKAQKLDDENPSNSDVWGKDSPMPEEASVSDSTVNSETTVES